MVEDSNTAAEKLSTAYASAERDEYPERSAGFCPSDVGVAPLADVQAALTVIGRRDTTKDNRTVVDLSRTCLRGANLTNADLSGTSLAGADLAGLDLSDASLHAADLTYAYLGGLNLTDVNLSDADLSGAYLGCTRDTEERTSTTSSYSLYCPTLSGVDLSRAKPEGTHLSGARLKGNFRDVDFSYADLRFAKLDDKNLSKADFFLATLAGAQLNRANLASAHLVAADLTYASLRHANLTNADLGHANLNGTDLTNAAHNSSTEVSKADTDEYTRGKWW